MSGPASDLYNAAPSASRVALEPDNLLPSIFHPAICPEVAETAPDILTADAVIWPVLFKIKLLFVEFICESETLKPAIVEAPCISAADAVICPLSFKIKLSFVEFICESETSNPPMDADLKLANPCGSIDADALETVEGEPPIEAGVLILFAVMSP